MKEYSTENKIAALQGLKNDLGWKLIVEELDFNIELVESKLFGEEPLAEDETVEALQKKRINLVNLKTMPQRLIEELSEEESNENFNVYD